MAWDPSTDSRSEKDWGALQQDCEDVDSSCLDTLKGHQNPRECRPVQEKLDGWVSGQTVKEDLTSGEERSGSRFLEQGQVKEYRQSYVFGSCMSF
jgi:hypothetical protein